MPLSSLVPSLCLGSFMALLIPLGGWAAETQSKYAGQEKRDIKSLSDDDIAELRRGGGWGLAKAAELNGVPGPTHLLELKDKIPLDAEQVEKLQALYDKMTEEAKAQGESFISLEAKLNEEFRSGIINDGLLQTSLGYIEEARRKLRYIHLSAHLQTLKILTTEQIAQYNHLRGYDAMDDVCANVPEGHDATLWRKHNDCDQAKE
nr:hypothetical protein [uncultured Cohaesibacter sp.]